jgi:hypothetical protein
MSVISHTTIAQQIQELALQAGLSVAGAGSGTDFTGAPTAKLQLKAASGTTYSVETSEALSAEIEKRASLGDELKTYLLALAKRMQTPRPDVFLTLHGLPLSMQQFSWPYHRSTSGADSFILHGIAQLAEPGRPLHVKVAASLTVTFADVLPALEQPYAECVTFNAIRKTLDLGQLELLKSGNRQPVPVSTKVFWTSARLAEGKPSWIADPYDAQYLDCSTEDLRKIAREIANEGLLTLDSSGEYATASAKLSAQSEKFVKQMESALALLKPKFNEEMRAGHTNM